MTSPMPPILKSLLLVAAVSATLSACNRDREPAAPAPAPAATPAVVTPAEAGAPFAFDSKTPFANVKLALPQAVKTQPELHVGLYAEAVRDLRQFTEGAQADRTEAGGDEGMPPYEKTITYDGAVETARLFSLSRADYDFTGGAHGNTLFAGVLWDKTLKRPLAAAQLFRPGADFAALDRALCAAINAEKKKRDPRAVTLTLSSGSAGKADWSCPKAATTPFVLAAGSAPGKAGGLTFLLAPYLVGPYSDGAWRITVPQSAFRALLAPRYVDEFAGDPAPSST